MLNTEIQGMRHAVDRERKEHKQLQDQVSSASVNVLLCSLFV